MVFVRIVQDFCRGTLKFRGFCGFIGVCIWLLL